ncbi:hypothetical protein [uncultured Methylobacterium sp.]|uniref:hypothetical protein n=1 Tax=uncultured Methylobacterium sp. TaxID=157278 RepID=UPI0026349E0B|nr:hypothetical protein [uncultured Methylobacterium sp.]
MTTFCDDDELGYRRSRTVFRVGEGLHLDESYRRAHLPLVAPDHPGVIREERGYRMGRRAPMRSVVVPVPGEALEAAPAFRALDAALRAAPFAGKLAWPLLARRRDRLHATLAGLGPADAAQPLGAEQRAALARLGPVAVELRGLFSGTINLGRLYLRAYPERRGDENAFRLIQRALGRPETDLALVGLHNLTDDLSAPEAEALAHLIAEAWDRPLLRFTVDRLWLLESRDDLVLDAAVIDTPSLGGTPDRGKTVGFR